jgi:hypothetical protein
MVSNLISGTLSEADQAAVLAAITTIPEKIPFLLSLTPDQRRELVKMGSKSESGGNGSGSSANNRCRQHQPGETVEPGEGRRERDCCSALYHYWRIRPCTRGWAVAQQPYDASTNLMRILK